LVGFAGSSFSTLVLPCSIDDKALRFITTDVMMMMRLRYDDDYYTFFSQSIFRNKFAILLRIGVAFIFAELF